MRCRARTLDATSAAKPEAAPALAAPACARAGCSTSAAKSELVAQSKDATTERKHAAVKCAIRRVSRRICNFKVARQQYNHKKSNGPASAVHVRCAALPARCRKKSGWGLWGVCRRRWRRLWARWLGRHRGGCMDEREHANGEQRASRQQCYAGCSSQHNGCPNP